MPDATAAAPPPPSSIDPHEAAHFGGLAAEWWDPKGSSGMLHRLNPVRLRFIRATIDAHFGTDTRERRPLVGRRALDVGCGGGLLAEAVARLGAETTAIDAAPEAIAVARAHAEAQGLAIDYRTGGVETLGDGAAFALVTALEVIEHVVDPAAFVQGLARMLAPGGLLVLSTPNRTALSRLALITAGEGLNLIPRGTHDWDRFIAPETLEALLAGAGLGVISRSGVALSPARGFVLSEDMAMNYMLAATRASSRAGAQTTQDNMIPPA